MNKNDYIIRLERKEEYRTVEKLSGTSTVPAVWSIMYCIS